MADGWLVGCLRTPGQGDNARNALKIVFIEVTQPSVRFGRLVGGGQRRGILLPPSSSSPHLGIHHYGWNVIVARLMIAGAGATSLIHLIGGDAETMARAKPVLSAIGSVAHHAGLRAPVLR